MKMEHNIETKPLVLRNSFNTSSGSFVSLWIYDLISMFLSYILFPFIPHSMEWSYCTMLMEPHNEIQLRGSWNPLNISGSFVSLWTKISYSCSSHFFISSNITLLCFPQNSHSPLLFMVWESQSFKLVCFLSIARLISFTFNILFSSIVEHNIETKLQVSRNPLNILYGSFVSSWIYDFISMFLSYILFPFIPNSMEWSYCIMESHIEIQLRVSWNPLNISGSFVSLQTMTLYPCSSHFILVQ